MSQSNVSIGTGDGYVRATFQALVDAIIPPTIRHTGTTGVEFVAGAVQLCLDQFVMENLDHSHFIPVDANQIQIPLSRSTALLLEIGAEQFIKSGLAQQTLNVWGFPFGGLFTALSRVDRLQTLALLDRLDIPLHMLPPPYQNYPAMIQIIINSLYQFTMFGYYSEWFGYGTTRLFPPEYRSVEFFSPGWSLAGYPGPAFGYRDFRGSLLKYPKDEGGHPNV